MLVLPKEMDRISLRAAVTSAGLTDQGRASASARSEDGVAADSLQQILACDQH